MKDRLKMLSLGVVAVAAVGAVGAGRRPTAPTAGDACDVEGVWESVSLTMDGRRLPTLGRPARKIHTRGHYLEVGAAARRDTLPLRSALDTLRARAVFAGAGRYRVRGDTFIQTVDLFSDPRMEGATLVGRCRTAHDTLVYEFTIPADRTGSGRAVHVSEAWHRVR